MKTIIELLNSGCRQCFRKCFRKYFRRCFRKSEVTKCIFYPAYLVQNSEGCFRGAGSASGGASGSTSGGASGSRKLPKSIKGRAERSAGGLVSDQSTAVEPISDQIGIGHLTSAKLGLVSDQCRAKVGL